MTEFDFDERLTFSKGSRGRCDDDTLMTMIPSAVEIRDGNTEEDKRGIDKVVRLSSGRTLAVDLKVRDTGAAKWWKTCPDLALERWSVKPQNGSQGKVGWTLDPAKRTDLVLFLFDPAESTDCYLVGFHHLRAAFLRCGKEWWGHYKRAPQNTEGRYQSECVFVPVAIVLDAITAVSEGKLAAS
jgi:hypothetical protein